ncbi:hypothetical protein [Pseudomonas oryzihabitans]|uniref:hypothetical protein n=1 Tax=Pseudomonas oryzihabitans TaxID=47885 RepID=UPI0015E35BD0|nr:hypothetical protein [Pseudomonas psychrotolerans]
MKVTTNNVPRDILNGFELSAKEWDDFDYVQEDERDSRQFFRYRGNLYDLGDAMRVEQGNSLCKGWHGYYGETFFSAVVFRFVGDEQVVVGHAFS